MNRSYLARLLGMAFLAALLTATVAATADASSDGDLDQCTVISTDPSPAPGAGS